MKYAFMSFSTPDMSLAEMIQTAARFGYDGVELRLDADHAHGIEVCTSGSQRKVIKEQVLAGTIKIVCLAISTTKRAIKCLQSDSYRGYISGEWINWGDCGVYLPRELNTLKSYE